MPKSPYKYHRRPVEIAEDKYLILRERARETGMKLYAMIDDVLDAGMKRKRLVPEPEPEGEGKNGAAKDK